MMSHISRALNFRSAFIPCLQECCLPLSLLSFDALTDFVTLEIVQTPPVRVPWCVLPTGLHKQPYSLVTSSSTWQCKVSFRANTALTKDPHFRGTRSLWQFVHVWCLCQLLNHRKLLIPSHLLQNTFQSLLTDCFEYFRQLEVQCAFSFDCFYYSQNFLFLIELSDSVFVSLLLSQQFSAPQGKHAWSCHGSI